MLVQEKQNLFLGFLHIFTRGATRFVQIYTFQQMDIFLSAQA